jgi:hypothetical protein
VYTYRIYLYFCIYIFIGIYMCIYIYIYIYAAVVTCNRHLYCLEAQPNLAIRSPPPASWPLSSHTAEPAMQAMATRLWKLQRRRPPRLEKWPAL